MNISDFDEEQKEALLDLALLAMYADGHLASAEDERVHRLLGELGCTSEYDRDKCYDASNTRLSRLSQGTEASRAHAVALARRFSTMAHRQKVLEILEDLVGSDRNVAPQEGSFLSAVKQALK